MSKNIVLEVDVMFGDCDPAGIVYFPNFHRWMDSSSVNFFLQCGVAPLKELTKTHGIVGTPLVENHVKFSSPATFGDRLQIHTSIIEWHRKVFIHKHVVKRGNTVLCEGEEKRAFVIRSPDAPERIKAIPIPQDIKALCI